MPSILYAEDKQDMTSQYFGENPKKRSKNKTEQVNTNIN